jgi:hypothetical protein
MFVLTCCSPAIIGADLLSADAAATDSLAKGIGGG